MHGISASLFLLLAASTTAFAQETYDPPLGAALSQRHLTDEPLIESWPPVAVAENFAREPERLKGLTWVELPGSLSRRAFTPAAVTKEAVCETLAAAAEQHDLPVVFFARLIWQESRFNRWAVSHAGAQGLAQFMPKVAAELGLSDPHDPLEALPVSARLLARLHQQFGNWGLAAAAYNGGPRRIRNWLDKRGKLPKETRDYVLKITGLPAEKWVKTSSIKLDFKLPARAPCREQITARVPDAQIETPTATQATAAARAIASAPAPSKVADNGDRSEKVAMKPASAERFAGRASKHAGRIILASADAGDSKSWGVQLAADFTDSKALARYERMKKQHGKLLRDAKTVVATRASARGSKMRQVRVVFNSRTSAQQLCTQLRAAGGACMVQKN